jgi:hypothetical protein
MRALLLVVLAACSSGNNGGTGGGSGGSGGSGGGSGGSGGTGGSSSAGSLFPDKSASGSTNGREPQLIVDATGRLHLLYTGFTMNSDGVYPVRYGECSSACNTSAGWTFATVADHGLFGAGARLALDSSGRPRVAFNASTTLGDDRIDIATCDSNCTQASNWQSGEVRSFTNGSYLIADGANLAVAPNGKLMIAYQAGDLGASYGECSANCTQSASWAWVQFDSGVSQPALAATSTGKPRIIFKNRNAAVLEYTECDTSCTQAGQWSAALPLYYASSENWAFRLDAQDRPRIAWNQGHTAIAGQEMNDEKIFYGWCDANCTMVTSWSAFDVGLAAGPGQESLGLTLDSTGAPLISFDDSLMGFALALRACTAGCNTSSATWSSVDLESSDQLTASDPPLLPVCNQNVTPKAHWYPGHSSSVVINTVQGAVQIAHIAETLQQCGNGTVVSGPTLTRFTHVPF